MFSDGEEVFLSRNGHTYDDAQKLIHEFWETCTKFQRRLKSNLPDCVHEGIEHYSFLLRDKKKLREITPSEKNTLQRKLRILTDLTKLNIYSWVRGFHKYQNKVFFLERRAI
jgi:hypothetical protein